MMIDMPFHEWLELQEFMLPNGETINFNQITKHFSTTVPFSPELPDVLQRKCSILLKDNRVFQISQLTYALVVLKSLGDKIEQVFGASS